MKKLLLSILILLAVTTESWAQFNRQTDSLALVEVYNALNGTNWFNQNGWATRDSSIDQWYGVTLNSSFNRVTEISFYRNNLEGTIPGAIGRLDSLRTLYFNWDGITGSIPDTLFNLKALGNITIVSMYFGSNPGLSGTISSQFTTLTRLTSLQLSGNKLTGPIPTFWNLMPNLHTLDLSDNQFTGTIPLELGNATQLYYLRIAYNSQLTAGPLPSQFNFLINVYELDVSGCKLTSVPSLSGMTALQSLSLRGNQISGSIASLSWIGNLPVLSTLDISLNRFTPAPIPSWIYNKTTLTNLNLENDSLTGSIAPAIGRLTNLNQLYLSNNSLNGSIPDSIGNLTNLSTFWVDNNYLTGVIPGQITNAINLSYVRLQNNQLTGMPDLSSMSQLNFLYVNNNKLTFGDIEPNIGGPNYDFGYSPQDSVGLAKDTLAQPGTVHTISVADIPVGGVGAKNYQWLKDGVTISGATTSMLTISGLTVPDAGTYVCAITYSGVPNLTLYSRNYNLNVFIPPLSVSDSLAVVALYDSLGGVNWYNQFNWKTSNPLSTWFGITLTSYLTVTRVTGINLNNNNLNGVIPQIIGNLDSLKQFELGGNPITGPFPKRVVYLKGLQYLNLYGMTYYGGGFSGSLPDSIGEMTDLRLLYLNGSGLSGSIPPSFGSLSRLETLQLNDNYFTGGLPVEFWSLSNLDYLNIGNSGLSIGALSPLINTLTKLTHLEMYNSSITSIPNDLSALTSLSFLDIGNNQITGTIPASLSSLTNLQNLYTYNNPFTPGPLPTFLGNMPKLQSLYMSGNSITGTVPSLANDTNLYYLNLQNNQIDNFPDLSGMTNLVTLYLDNNRLDFGDIQPNIVATRTFYYSPQADVGTAKDTSLFPSDSYTMSVASINVGGTANQYQWMKDYSDIPGATSISYTITSATATDNGSYVCKITDNNVPDLILQTRPINVFVNSPGAHTGDSLALVALYDNMGGASWFNQTNWKSSAPIGQWFGVSIVSTAAATRVSGITLSNNNLQGTIPAALGRMDSLRTLNLFNASFSGTIPDSIYALKELRTLNIRTTTAGQLTGSLSVKVGRLTNLTSLSMSGNALSGNVPDSLFSLTGLITLSIGDNQFTGTVSPLIGNLVNLASLRMAGNQFTGAIPTEIGNLSGLTLLTLANNQFTGIFPVFLCNLTNLQTLDIGNNQFTPDVIPSAIGNLYNLRTLNLNDLSLVGSIPVEIGRLSFLMTLNLAGNQLSGAVTDSLTNIASLQFLYLDNNQFDNLPDLSLLNLTSFHLDNNKFDFGDLIPNTGAVNTQDSLIYSPQDSIQGSPSIAVYAGTPFSVSVQTYNNGANAYQWFRKGSLLLGATGSSYSVSSASASNTGSYYCRITNPALPNLALYTKTIRVSIETAPATPQLSSVAPGNGTATLTWVRSADTDLRTHYIYAGQSLNPTTLVDSTLFGTDTTKTLYGLTIGQMYFFRVKAVDTLGQVSPYSNELSAVIKDATPPAQPTGFTAYAGNDEVKLFWDAGTGDADLSHFILYRSTTPAFTPTPADSQGLVNLFSINVASGVTTYYANTHMDLDVDNETTYYYKLRAMDSSGNEGALSAELTVTPSSSIPAWISQATPASGNFFDVKFTDPRNGYVSTQNGAVLRTTNGGQNWMVKTLPTYTRYRALEFLDSLSGWVGGDIGSLYLTNDGGDSWTQQFPPFPTEVIRDITFINASNGWYGGSVGVRYTTNSGGTWNAPVSALTGNYRGVSFTDALNGWASRVLQTPAQIYKTVDGGQNWALQADFGTTYPGYSFRNSQMMDASTGYVVGGNVTQSLILKTTDGGNSWIDVTPPSFGIIQALDFIDVNNGWFATDVGMVFHTTNGGASWEFQSTRTSGTFYAVDVIQTQGLGWLTKVNGAVFKLNTAGAGANQPPVITLTSPSSAAGDTGWGGRTGQISWNANDDNGVAKVVIEYANNASNFVQIGESFTANGAFVWDLPDNESTVNGAIRVTVYDQQGLSSSAQSIAPLSIFPNGSYTHVTSQASLTVQNNGAIGTGLYHYNKPSLEYPAGGTNNQLLTGLLYVGFVRNIGDTVGVANLYEDNRYKPITPISISEFGSYKQSVSTYSDNFGAGLEIQQTTVSKNDGKFFVMEYAVTNKSVQSMNSVALGQWFDFDVKPNPALNLTGFDLSQFLAYMYDANNPNGTYVGVRMIDADPTTFRRGTNVQSASLTSPGMAFATFTPGADVTTSDTAKNYTFELGGTYFINPDQTVAVTFAVCTGTGLSDLQVTAAEAQSFWTAIRTAPVTPTGVSASPVSEKEIDLSWNVVDNASLYRIYRSISSNSGYVQVDSVSAPATSYADSTGLQPASLYFYKVSAVNAIGTSSLSTAQFASTNTPSPPDSPTGLTVSTVSTTSLKLDWTASVNGYVTKYKIYRKGPTDGDFVQIDSVPEVILTYTNTGLTENTTYFYKLIAAHSWGISDFTAPVSGNTMMAAPSITGGSVQVNPNNPTENQAVTITVPVSGSGLSVKIFFGFGYQIVGDSADMNSGGGNSYSFTVAANRVDYRGLWYRIKAINSAGVDIYPAVGRNDINVSVSNNSVATIIASSAYPLGVEVDGYSTISLPLNTSLNLIPILGAQEFDGNNVPTNWRAVTYNPTNLTFSNVTSLENNTAYFLFIRGNDPVAIFSDMTAGNTNPKTLFDSYVLRPGWNLVPWPFAFGANITVTDAAKIDPIWQMSGGDWNQVSLVKAFGGYAIKNKTAGNVVLGTVLNWTTAAGKHLADADWSIRFKADATSRQDHFNYIGVSSLSEEKYDIYDVSEPMSMGGDISLYFTAKNELDQAEKLASDVRSNTVDGNIWEMNVANNVNEKTLTLNWEQTSMPTNYKMMMVDVNNNEFINLEEMQTYSFRARKDNKFKVVVGKDEFVDQVVEKIREELPKEFALAQNYPNPFNPTTHINFDVARSGNVRLKVYNVLGQEVTTLVDGYFETGKHDVMWNGRDALGRQVASGVYMYRLEAGKVSKTKKMLFVK